MRENKCRAWDTKWHRWILPRDIVLYGGEWYFDRRAEAEGDIIECTGLEEVILEWFTGIKDKNGVDSYGGDIICYPNDYPQSYGEPPEPNNDIGEIYWNEKETGFWARSGANARTPEDMPLGQFVDEYGEFEVIGNIHENKDLL